MTGRVLGSVAALFASTGALHAAPPTVMPVRTVQLISMQASASTKQAAAEDAPAPSAGKRGDSPASPVDAVASFRLHDLSRRWVEFQMRNEFAVVRPERRAGAASVTADDPADPFAQVGVARIDTAPATGPALMPASTITVPAWMRRRLAFSAAATKSAPGCSPSEYRPSGFLAGSAEIRRAGFYRMMSSIACQYGIPVGLFDAMIIRESAYQAWAFSTKSAYGLTQLMPRTAAGLGVNRYDIEDNLRGGAMYLRQQLDLFGHPHLALAAYNAGPGRVRNGQVPRIAETQAYVSDILNKWRFLAGASPTGGAGIAIPTRSAPESAAWPPGRVVTVSSF
jgi:soluble lytic murein transglycosylase-like protein